VTTNERRAEIMRLLTVRRRDTTPHLAQELGVSTRTILRDIEALTCDYPLITKQGNGGYVAVEDWYHPYKQILTREQQTVLSTLMGTCDSQQALVLQQLLSEYGSKEFHIDERRTAE